MLCELCRGSNKSQCVAAKKNSAGHRPALFETKRSLERETGFEPAAPTLARLCSTTELFPLRDVEDSDGSADLSTGVGAAGGPTMQAQATSKAFG